MDLPSTTVTVLEDNETRADLYELWLDDCEVRVGLTKRQADAHLDVNVAVVVLDQEFADGIAPKVLDLVRQRAPACQVVSTRTRAAAFPTIDADEHLAKPVFEDDLVPLIKRLLHRVNYHVAITRYYDVTARLTTLERSEGNDDQERYDRLDRQATFLRKLLAVTRSELTDTDVAAVLEEATVSKGFADRDVDEESGSKYRPDECQDCGTPWNGRPGPTSNYTRLGAFVWRCGECGDVAMISDPSHKRLGSYRV